MRINVVIINPVFLAAFFGTGTACALVIVASLLRFPGGGSAYLHVGGILYLVGSFLVTVVFKVPKNKALALIAPCLRDSRMA